MRATPLLLALAGLSFSAMAAEPFLGAEAVLKKLALQSADPQSANPGMAFREALKRFEAGADALAPQEAATQWMALFAQYAALPQDVRELDELNGPRLSVSTLLSALPASRAWEAFPAAAAGRSPALQLLGAVLAGDEPVRRKLSAEWRKSAEKKNGRNDFESRRVIETLDGLEAALRGSSEELADFEKQLGLLEKPSDDDAFPAGYLDGPTLTIPDLVKIAGETAARPLILRVLPLGRKIDVRGEATRKFTARLALEQIASFKTPAWGLIREPGDMALYEAFAKLPVKSGRDWERRGADIVYLLALISKNRAAEAVPIALKAGQHMEGGSRVFYGPLFEDMRRQGFGPQILLFLREVLTQEPASGFWSDFIVLSAQENQSKAALEFLRESLQKPGLKDAARADLQRHYFAALLAAGDEEEGTRILRELVANKKGVSDPTHAVEDAVRLATLGGLLGRPELVEEGLAAARARQQKPGDTSPESSIVRLLVELERAPEAEAIAAAQLLKAGMPSSQQRMSPDETPVRMLAGIYDRSGRAADVLRLLDEAPVWGAADLEALLKNESRHDEAVPVGMMAARALAAAGRPEDARRVLERVLEESPGHDPAYALLLQLGGANLEARLDALAARDRFEERPLIWKAQLLFNAGRLKEAEKTARAAIAIDPSDGEQGKGDRMRAYAVLGDVLEKKGDAAQAKTMRGAVAAIRLSERADDFWKAGLLSRAIKMYEEALGKFADAYCIQSRLALRYSEAGEFEKAEQAYRRAFELMPESFGRVESHCFGCEHAFEGLRAQSVAEKVFEALAVKLPDRPQVFYLLGYLRSSQQRPAEAAAFFRKAVALDPDYLNAWVKLQNLAGETALPAADAEAAALAILRLDPLGRHARAELKNLPDLKKVWAVLRPIRQSLPSGEPRPLYPLAASARELAKPGASNAASSFERYQEPSAREQFDSQFTDMPVMRALSVLLELTLRRE